MGKESLAVTFLEETLQLDVEIGPSRLFDLEHGTVLHCPAIPLWLAEALTRLGDSERTLSLLEDGLTEARRSDIGYAISHGTAALGRLAMSKGDYDVAAQRFKESVRLSVKYSDVLEKIGAMDLVAQAAAAQGREERAVRLWGAVDAARAVTNNPRKSSDEGEYQERVSGIHHQLGNQAFDKVYATGQAMTIEQAVAYALSDA
jgi:tetratricopeptide (TPR) repeat protein